MPVEVPGQMFAFGLFESRDEGMVARDAEQRAGNGNGDRNGGDGNMDDMTSGGNIKLRLHCWLQRINICATPKEIEMATHLCHPGHPPIPQNICMDALGINVDAKDSNLNLQKSAKPHKLK